MIVIDDLETIFIRNSGIMKTSELKAIGLESRKISMLLRENILKKIKTEVYSIAGEYAKNLRVTQKVKTYIGGWNLMNIRNLIAITKKDTIDTRSIAAFIDFVNISLLTMVLSIVIDSTSFLTGVIMYSVIVIIYFSTFESLTGSTPGKFVLRLKVVNSNCEKPSFRQALIRALFWLIEVNPVIFLCVITFFISRNHALKQRFGDRLAATFVVRISDLKFFMNNESIQTMDTDEFIYEYNKPKMNIFRTDGEGRILENVTEVVFEGDKKFKIRGLRGMTVYEIIDEIDNGGEFRIFKYCLSVVFAAEKKSSDIYFVKHNEKPIKHHWIVSLETFIFGWWSLPGIFWTVECLVTNFKGGIDVTEPVSFAISEYYNHSCTI